MARTLDQLITTVRQRLGWPADDSFVSYDEMRHMLQTSQRELNSFLVQVHQGNFRVATLTMAMTAGVQLYAPNTFMAVLAPVDRPLRVAAVIDGVSIPMRRLDWEAGELLETSQTWDRNTDMRYRFVRYFPESNTTAFNATESAFWFYPTPSAAYVVKVTYVMGLSSFSVTNAINAIGHDEYLVLDTCIQCVEAEEGDPSKFEARKERYIQSIQENETPIDIGQPQTIVDTRWAARDRFWP